MVKKQKILIVAYLTTTNWGASNAGGVDSVCQMVSEFISKQINGKYTYRVLAFNPLPKDCSSPDLIKIGEDIEVVFSPTKRKYVPGFLYQLVRIKKEISKFEPNLVHAHSWNWLLPVKKNVPSVVTVHGYMKIARASVGFLNDLFYEKIVPALTARRGHVVCVGNLLREIVSAKIGREVDLIHNPISYDYFMASRGRSFEKNNIDFVTCSVITPRKQIDKIIDLISICVKKGVLCKLKIIGPIEDKLYYLSLLDKIKINNLGGTVEFLGGLSRGEIIQIYENSDFGVFFSREETFGLAPLEMLAAGLPLFSTEVGILKERRSYFEKIGVSFIDVNNLDVVADNVLHNLNIKREVLRNEISVDFSVESVVQKYESLYSRLLNNV